MHIFPRHTFIILLISAVSWGCSAGSGEQVADEDLLRDVSGTELEEVIAAWEGEKAVLVNVWATWCIPCVEEFPELLRIQANYEGDVQVILVSADFPDERDRALQFLRDRGVNWTTYFKTGRDQPFIEALSADWSGALPFTRIIARNGETVSEWENKADYETFEKFVNQAIKP